MAVRVAKFEVIYRRGDAPRFAVWRDLSESCQVASNVVWRTWLVNKLRDGCDRKVAEAIEVLRRWHNADRETRGPKPKFPDLKAWTKDDDAATIKALAEHCPALNARTKTLLTASLKQKIVSRKSANSSLPGWWSILLGRESIPSSIHPQPIPFDRANGSILEPAEGSKNYRVQVRIDRIDNGTARAVSTQDTFELFTSGSRCRSQLAILKNCIGGAYKFCGSALTRQRGKWFLLLCFDRLQEPAPPAGERTAWLWADYDRPWSLTLDDGATIQVGGRGAHVAPVRRQLMAQRRSRAEGYRYSSSARKGHGRQRGNQWRWRLSERWKDFTKSFNHETSRRVLEVCRDRGVGKLVYLQPDDPRPRFLESAGATAREPGSWDWFQVGAQLKYKSEDFGVKVVVQKDGVCGKQGEIAPVSVEPALALAGVGC